MDMYFKADLAYAIVGYNDIGDSIKRIQTRFQSIVSPSKLLPRRKHISFRDKGGSEESMMWWRVGA